MEKIEPGKIFGDGGEAPTMTVRYKGFRSGEWCILDADGQIVEKGYENRGQAERRLKHIIEAKQQLT